MRVRLLTGLLVLSFISPALAHTNHSNLPPLARRAVSADASEAEAAIDELRSQGPAGFAAFLAAHNEAISMRRLEVASVNPPAASLSWQRISAAMDRIAGQKDSLAAGLYWYTDFEQACAAARHDGKPILSLRLLGRLDEELSCANSRFFRLTLYSNQEISRLLRERFILHWQSVRPVPKVTIDFGDGRKLERTLTGNSIHYILDREGHVVDALPGIYGPQAFLRELQRTAAICDQTSRATTATARAELLRSYHSLRLNELKAQWTDDLARADIKLPPAAMTAITGSDESKPPRAEVAARRAITKAVVVERPIIRGISLDPRLLDDQPEDAGWGRLAALHTEEAKLDAASRALIRSKNFARYSASDELQRAVTTLEWAIARDTTRNEYSFRRTLHQWLMNTAGTADLAGLNERVYAELFLTPSSDKWLGLFPDDSFTGIENDGVRR